MAQQLNIACRGLVTAPNPLLVPKDGLQVAQNVVIDRPGYIQSRKGFERQPGTLSGSIWKLAMAHGGIIANWGDASGALSLSRYASGAWTLLSSSVVNASAGRMSTAEANGNVFLTCAAGVQRLDSSIALNFAGMPKALGIDKYGTNPLSTTAPVFLSVGSTVAYRAVIGTRDASGNLLLGEPSSRCTVTNAAFTNGYSNATSRVTARVLLPMANNTTATPLTDSYFVQLYRSEQATSGTPSDDLQLVAEQYLSSADITAGYVDINDGTPDAFRGAYLYTNPTTGGDDGLTGGVEGVGNAPPPYATEVAWWRGCLWYGGTRERQRLSLQILGTGSGGLSAGHTLTIGGVVYTAIAPAAPAANEFVVENAGTASQNIEETAQNLVTAINKSASNTSIYAFYVSGEEPDTPGKILLETRTLLGSGFTAQASANGAAYVPNLTDAQASTADSFQDGVAFSRQSLPEAVPLLNRLRVGGGSATVLRMVPQRESLFVFTDRGLYRITGQDYSEFTVREFDLSAVLYARECVCTLDEDIYAWCEAGVARINEAGVSWVSQDIDFELQQLMESATKATLYRHAFMVAQPQDHRVLLWHPRSDSDTIAREAYCLSIRTTAWTKWKHADVGGSPDGRSSGVFHTDLRKLYLSDGQHANGYLYAETAIGDYSDTLSDGTSPGIPRIVTWGEQDADNAGVAKHWMEAQLLFGDDEPDAMTLTFATEHGSESVTPNTPAGAKLQRMPVGRAAGRGTRLTVTAADSTDGRGFDIAGLSLFFRTLSSRGMK